MRISDWSSDVCSSDLLLSLLILPVIVISTREGLRSVPREIRDASLALGATKWQTVWRQVLPAGVPSIATWSILALSRALGEAAPPLVPGALVYITLARKSVVRDRVVRYG